MSNNEMKSLRSTHTVSATFINATERTVDLYWVDFQGKLVRYASSMAPGKKKHISTFVTHPWTARDNVTGQRLCLLGQAVYVTPIPPGREAEVEEDHEFVPDAPIHVGSLEITINIPVFRLEDICTGFFRRQLSTQNVGQLELNAYLREKLTNIPKPQARIYHPVEGIMDE